MNLKRLLTLRSEEKVLSTLHLHDKFRNSLLSKMAVLMQKKSKCQDDDNHSFDCRTTKWLRMFVYFFAKLSLGGQTTFPNQNSSFLIIAVQRENTRLWQKNLSRLCNPKIDVWDSDCSRHRLTSTKATNFSICLYGNSSGRSHFSVVLHQQKRTSTPKSLLFGTFESPKRPKNALFRDSVLRLELKPRNCILLVK